jgi:hypothetical protein
MDYTMTHDRFRRSLVHTMGFLCGVGLPIPLDLSTLSKDWSFNEKTFIPLPLFIRSCVSPPLLTPVLVLFPQRST